ncbi:MAG: hypothetical protein KJ749_15555, partial [Planctomycetes bacterium]|nr:hypothetical protein [Planctomycetota bacterium]
MRRTDSQHLGSDQHIEPASRSPRVIRLRMAVRRRFRQRWNAPHLSPLTKGGFRGVGSCEGQCRMLDRGGPGYCVPGRPCCPTSPLTKGGYRGVIRLPTAVLVGAAFVTLTILAVWHVGCG